MRTNKKINNNINAIKIKLASPETILGWSYGEVTKPETINYKTLKAEEGGLFDERIFGPVRDYTCSCGKYKHAEKDAGKVCEKCGIEIIESIVRRERMGHIKLAVPIAHTWYIKELPNPSKISLVLGCDRKIEEVIYFMHYVVLDNAGFDQYFVNREIIDLSGKDSRKNRGILRKILNDIIKPKLKKDSLSFRRCTEYFERLQASEMPFSIDEVYSFISTNTGIRFGIGSEAILELLKNIDLKKEIATVKRELKIMDPIDPAFNKLVSRQKVLNWFKDSGNKPEWMILSSVPVTPPETRPLVQLENGQFAVSGINELYRKVIIRNDRLVRLIAESAPAIIINNEKRMLQEAVDGLFDNSSRNKPNKGKDKTVTKSLTDHLKGKTGLFRQNLLGKRVDYSGRSAIVGGPELKLYQAGIPSDIVLKLYEPFIISELIKKEDEFGNEVSPITVNIKDAKRLILRQDDIIWPIVNRVVRERPVLLNRAPTLHRLGIQAFEVKIIPGKAIRLHPLVCSGFNADFDGDTMAIHLPISKEAVAEARVKMLASNNIIAPKDGKPIVTPTIDMLVGTYYTTTEKHKQVGEGSIFSTVDQVLIALDLKHVNLHTIIAISTNAYVEKGYGEDKFIITSVGKVLFNSILPAAFPYVNGDESIYGITNDDLADSSAKLAELCKDKEISTPISKSGLSTIIFAIYKLFQDQVAKTVDGIKDLGFKYATQSGISFSIFDLPDYKKKDTYIEKAREQVANLKEKYQMGLLTDDERYARTLDAWKQVVDSVQKDMREEIANPKAQDQSVIIMNKSGARGNLSQYTQMVGLRGLMAKSYNYTDKSKSSIVKDTIETPIVHSFKEGMSISEFFNASYGGRKAMVDTALKTSKSGYMTRKLVDSAQEIIISQEDCGTTKGLVVSAIRNDEGQIIETLKERIEFKYSVQAIPGVVKENELITEEIANAIVKKVGADGSYEVRSAIHCNCKNGICQHCHGIDLATSKPIEIGATIGVVAGQALGEPVTQINMNTKHTGGVSGGAQIAQGYERIKQLLEIVPIKDDAKARISPVRGKVTSIDSIINEESGIKVYQVSISSTHNGDVTIACPETLKIIVKKGDEVDFGTKLTTGSVQLKELLQIRDIEAVRLHLIEEVQKVYRSQGISVSDKYVEIIISQMTNKLKVRSVGDSALFTGQLLTYNQLIDINNALLTNDQEPATATFELLGLEDIPENSESFLSAASFQYTKKVLINAAIQGQVDTLDSLKANVMLGKLIPAGSSFANEDAAALIKAGEEVFKKEY